ncbi:MAG: CDP-alcohol phosphatidyltransferase family protein [Methylotetracoccus sp.]
MTDRLATTLSTWSRVHGVLMLGGMFAASLGLPLAAIGTGAVASFVLLTWRTRGHWTPTTRFGSANAVSMTRLALAAMILSDPAPPAWFLAALAGAALLLDGLDGWLARRFRLSSRYGDLLDKEVDAFLTAALCLVLYRSTDLNASILIPAALRYLYVLRHEFAAQPIAPQPATRFGRMAGAIALGSLVVCLLPIGAWRAWLGGLATALVLTSFARSLWQEYR